MQDFLRNFLFDWRPVATPRRRRSGLRIAERLEDRTLLDGNVTALVASGDLSLEGDVDNNSVEVTVVDGDVIVRGLDGTTINGSADPFVAFADTDTIPGDVTAELGDGDDVLFISGGLTIDGDVDVTDRSGANSLGVLNATIGGDLKVRNGAGADSISLENVIVDGSTSMSTSNGNDLIAILNSNFDGKVSIDAGKNNDQVVIQDSDLDSDFKLILDKGDDGVVIEDTEINGNLHINGGRQNDYIHLSGILTGGRSTIFGSLGNDTVVVMDDSQFEGFAFFGGILGRSDSIDISDDSDFDRWKLAPFFESRSVSQDVIDEQLNDDPNGMLTRAMVLREMFMEDDTPDDTVDGNVAVTADIQDGQETLESVNTTITKEDNLTFEGTTTPNATVTVDADGDGEYDDGTATTDENGDFTVDVTLGTGGQTVEYRVLDGTGDLFQGTTSTNVHKAIGTVTEFESNFGTFHVELLDTDAPITVANFKGYSERFTDSVIHRAPENFVIQGGGFSLDGDDLEAIMTDAPIQNEFNAANSNVRGTLSMALPADPNGGTSGWFINTVNNDGSGVTNNLDADTHTVFGRVIGDGMDIVDIIAAVPLNSVSLDVGSFTNIPLQNFDARVGIPGNVSIDAGTTTVTGNGTVFTDLAIDDELLIGNQLVTVVNITNDTELTIAAAHTDGATNVIATVENFPVAANFVVFSKIDEVLEDNS